MVKCPQMKVWHHEAPSCFLLFRPELLENHGNIKESAGGDLLNQAPWTSVSLPGGGVCGDRGTLPTCQDWTEVAPLDASARRWQGTEMMQAQQDMNSSTGQDGKWKNSV